MNAELSRLARAFLADEGEAMPDPVRLLFAALTEGGSLTASEVDIIEEWLTTELLGELDHASEPTERGRRIDDVIGKIQAARPDW